MDLINQIGGTAAAIVGLLLVAGVVSAILYFVLKRL